MNKLIVGFGSLVLTLALLTAPALAWQTERQDTEFTGKVVFSSPVDVNSSLTVGGTQLTASAAELNTVADGITATASDLNAVASYFNAWDPSSSATDASTTNGEIIAITAPFMVLTPNLSAATYTNTVVLGAPPAVGYVLTIAVGASSTTNVLGIADSGTASLAGAFVGGTADTLTLIGGTTATWYEVSRSDN